MVLMHNWSIVSFVDLIASGTAVAVRSVVPIDLAPDDRPQAMDGHRHGSLARLERGLMNDQRSKRSASRSRSGRSLSRSLEDFNVDMVALTSARR
jgi:hypothetical protein